MKLSKRSIEQVISFGLVAFNFLIGLGASILIIFITYFYYFKPFEV